jgi:hypothetical protein
MIRAQSASRSLSPATRAGGAGACAVWFVLAAACSGGRSTLAPKPTLDEGAREDAGPSGPLVACGTGEKPCDPTRLNGATCLNQGFGAGTLVCDPETCMYDTSMCSTTPTGPLGGLGGLFGGGGRGFFGGGGRGSRGGAGRASAGTGGARAGAGGREAGAGAVEAGQGGSAGEAGEPGEPGEAGGGGEGGSEAGASGSEAGAGGESGGGGTG